MGYSCCPVQGCHVQASQTHLYLPDDIFYKRGVKFCFGSSQWRCHNVDFKKAFINQLKQSFSLVLQSSCRSFGSRSAYWPFAKHQHPQHTPRRSVFGSGKACVVYPMTDGFLSNKYTFHTVPLKWTDAQLLQANALPFFYILGELSFSYNLHWIILMSEIKVNRLF